MPFTIKQTGRTFHALGFDVSSLAVTGKTYYVKTDGNDADTGLDEAHALQKISTAIAKADAKVVMVKAGWYTYGYGWDGSQPARDLSIIGYGGDAVLSAHIAGLVWSAVDSHYEASYATKTVTACVDKKTPDANGDYTRLVTKASVAQVDAAANSWYYDAAADLLYVRTADNREPDADILPFVQTYNIYLHLGYKLYLENITAYGGDSPITAALATAGANLYAKNCTAKYSYSLNGFNVTGCDTVILQGCIAARNLLDGYKCAEFTGRYSNLALINCIGRHNGTVGAVICNGYSRHDRGETVIINSEFYGNYGPNIHDIDNGAGDPLLWCLGTYAHDSAGVGAIVDLNFAIGTEVTTGGVAWLDTCKSDGSAKDLLAGTGATMNYHDLLPATPVTTGAGTFTAY